MRTFKTKSEIFEYICKRFSEKDVKGIVVKGSAAKKEIGQFSDIDIEIYNNKKIKPYYELVLLKDKLILISIYFYKASKKLQVKDYILVLKGDFFEGIEHKGNEKYSKQERIIRDNQMLVDCLFKYLRSKDKGYLNCVEKYCKF